MISLSPSYQEGLGADDYEVVIVDNGSPTPLGEALTAGLGCNVRKIRLDSPPPSPAMAANVGIAAARADYIGVMIDGCRLASPGLLHYSLVGLQASRRSVASCLGWYLGADLQAFAIEAGYDEKAEQDLLSSIGWPADGYRLFEVSTLDESSAGDDLSPLSESSALFMSRELWSELGGFDERFTTPGGGLVNIDTYTRALELPEVESVLLRGEGTFHQVHGGISTNAPIDRRTSNWNSWHDEYFKIRGHEWSLATRDVPSIHIGRPLETKRRKSLELVALESVSPEPVDPEVESLVALTRALCRSGELESAVAVARIGRRRAPRHSALTSLLTLHGHVLPSRPATAAAIAATGEAHRRLGEISEASACFHNAIAAERDTVAAHAGIAGIRMPGPGYPEWLSRIYGVLKPSCAVEIGVCEGATLALHQPPTLAIGIDPCATVTRQLDTETHIFAETSDDFFRRDSTSVLGGRPHVDVGFIDGLHVFEQALRDFMNLEAWSGDRSVIILHDTVPLDEPTQRPERVAQFYTGDVWKVVIALKRYRPDLKIFTIPTIPSGLTVVTRLDPSSRSLFENYDRIVADLKSASFEAIQGNLANELNVVQPEWFVVKDLLEKAGVLDSEAIGTSATGFDYHGDPRLPAALGPLAVREEWTASPDELLFDSDLGAVLAAQPGLHKWHHYTPIYESVLSGLVGRGARILEIGVYNGGSLRAWAAYLGPDSTVVGVDIDERCRSFEHPAKNIHVRIGAQQDHAFMASVVEEFGPFDVIIGDGSHLASHMKASFRYLFDEGLKRGGTYLVEDLHANYWRHYRDEQLSFVDLAKGLVDVMHDHYTGAPGEPEFRHGHAARRQSFSVPRVTPWIDSVQFYDSVVVIRKSRVKRDVPSTFLNPTDTN